jgi:hypothetical protein
MRMRRNARFSIVVAVVIAASLALMVVSGCETKSETGALVGGAAGAGVGGLATRNATGAVVGGAVGAGAGYLIGREGDRREKAREEADQPPPPDQTGNTVIVNVTNSNGSVTPVRLTRQGSGWVGPKGEYYSSLPTGDQLRPLYGF